MEWVLCAAGVSGNPFWVLLGRNSEGIDLYDERGDALVNRHLVCVFNILTDPGSHQGDDYPSLQRRPPHAWSFAERYPKRLSLGRVIRAVMQASGYILTGSIGPRCRSKDLCMLRTAIEVGAIVRSVDASVELPCAAQGMEVYDRPSLEVCGCLPVRWHRAFSGEPGHFMWTWYAGSVDACAERINLCRGILGEGASTDEIVASWAAGRRPRPAEVELVVRSHTVKGMEYLKLHHHVEPLCVCKNSSSHHVPTFHSQCSDCISLSSRSRCGLQPPTAQYSSRRGASRSKAEFRCRRSR